MTFDLLHTMSQVQRNIIPLPKSIKKERIIANANIFDFCLDQSDMEKIEDMDRGLRLFPMDECVLYYCVL